MDMILIFIASLGAAYLGSRLTKRGPFTLADFVIGVFGGLVGLILVQLFGVEGAGLPLLLAFGLTLGLESLQHRSLLS